MSAYENTVTWIEIHFSNGLRYFKVIKLSKFALYNRNKRDYKIQLSVVRYSRTSVLGT